MQDVDTREERLRAKYLVGADGAHSAVRDLLKIPFDGRGVFSNSITVYFEADVAKLMEGRNFSVQYILNPPQRLLPARQGDEVGLPSSTRSATRRSPKPATPPPTLARNVSSSSCGSASAWPIFR